MNMPECHHRCCEQVESSRCEALGRRSSCGRGREEPRCCAVGRCCRHVASERTVHKAWTVLRSTLSEAMREELVARNVAGLVRVPLPRAQSRAYWTVDEARRFLESGRSNDDPMYAG